ncbi:MAG: leucine-rich repeat protein [Gemmatimonadales bacterium]|nr:leucine-rich repeat protein [Candidatus Palauibacter irciniicola]MYG32669.1 leucine-rich repeat protein [Cenarchaeum sp. SB0677_bin_16]
MAAALLLAAIGSCDSDPVVEPEPSLEIVPDSVTLTHIGHQFTFSVRGGGAVQWNSRDLAVFTVNANGTVTARGNGEARVQAWTPQSSDHALVRVRQAPAVLEPFGEGQRAGLGLSLTEPVGVRVLDEGGVPVSGVAVRFEPGAGHGSIEPGEVPSDEEGLAAARWTLGPESGMQTLAVSVEGAASVTIAATALDPDEAVASFEVLSGRDQWAWSGRALAEPIAVRALDEAGRPISAATVRFEPDAGGRADPETAVSDSAGVVSTAWTLGTVPGPQALAVSTGGDANAEVIATARDPDDAVASVKVVSGDDQWAVARHALPDSVTVHVSDETRRPIWGAAVTFEPEAGGGHANPGTADTDSLGLASAVWTLGSGLGNQRMSTTAGGTTVTFEATAVSDEGVCNRTPAVSREIARRAGVGNCSEVTDQMLRSVRRLELDGKGIRQLRSGDFHGLIALDVLFLNQNELTELPPRIFEGLSTLRRLFLNANELTRLQPRVFRGLSGLQELFLWRNHLTELRLDAFSDLDALFDLGLDYNQLTELPEDLFDGLSNLTHLSMRGNKLTSLPDDIFANLSRLEYLVLGDNRLTVLPPGLFSETPSLWRIALDGNQLAELPSRLFWETSALQRLYLQGNRLETLPTDIFAGLQELVRLDLSRNDLIELPPGVFAGTRKLAQLSLEHNELGQLPPGLFAGLSALEWVTLQANPGTPFPIRPEFVRRDGDPLAPGPARVALRVSPGAPFAFTVPVSVQRGSISRDAVSLLAGETVSNTFEVSADSGGGAVHLGFPPLPEVRADGYEGLTVVRGEELVLFAEADNGSPVARSRIPAHRLQVGGPSAELVLADYFDDPDGDSLAFAVEMTESGVVAARLEDGVLWLDPQSVDTTVVEVTATDADGLRATQRFRAWVVPSTDPDAFNIELYFDPGFTVEEEAAVRRAADRWMEVVTGDLPDVPVLGPLSDICFDGPSPPRVLGVIDDLLIRVRFVARRGGAAATATRCGEREGSGHAFLGKNSFSLWYHRNPDPAIDQLYESALHEMGHVLGFGDWIHRADLEAWRAMYRGGGTDPHFTGPLAVAAFDAAGGEAYPGGKVPLEDKIPLVGIHWRQRVIPRDVMAPYADSLLTAMTVQTLADLGYEVDVSKADPYTLPGAAQGDVRGDGEDAEGAVAELFSDDVIRGPVIVVDSDGKAVRIIRP